MTTGAQSRYSVPGLSGSEDHPGAMPEKGRAPRSTTDPAIVDPRSRAVPAGSRTSANALTSVSNLIPPEVLPAFREPELLVSLR